MHTSGSSFHFNLPTNPFHFPEPAQTSQLAPSRPRLLALRTQICLGPRRQTKKPPPDPRFPCVGLCPHLITTPHPRFSRVCRVGSSMVEQRPFKALVESSSLSQPTPVPEGARSFGGVVAAQHSPPHGFVLPPKKTPSDRAWPVSGFRKKARKRTRLSLRCPAFGARSMTPFTLRSDT